MIKRIAVELYSLLAGVAFVAALVVTYNAIQGGHEAPVLVPVLLVAGAVLGIMAMVAADTRQRGLYKRTDT